MVNRDYFVDNEPLLSEGAKDDTEIECYSDVGYYSQQPVPKKIQRSAKKRADIQASARSQVDRITPTGEVWACCCASELGLDQLQNIGRRRILSSSKLDLRFEAFFSEVFFAWIDLRHERNDHSHEGRDSRPQKSVVFLFKFGCVVAWDLPPSLQKDLLVVLEAFLKDPSPTIEEDSMNYTWAFERKIKQDIIHLHSNDPFERLAYSYAFAQSCKLSVFEDRVEQTIDGTREVPESLAKTGKIPARRDEISKRIGELFLNRFYINLHTDILDTPDVFWEFDEFADLYTSCRSYLEIPKRVEILNQRLDIMKDLYDMLNQELTYQHGYKLEWIVIYLIVIEVVIEVVWNIIIRDTLKLV
eukprot:Protomagalhaensia_sp_Gyna_25__1952@NODE_203_length_4429_cov_86_930296_g157_i0_p2_GENE_NODE_203_length_4429_cov_86_930296_g157_i0NODE_203_length_4429_cov_86_930296_g157_i0_p2_ORF_typecomplete_len358_score35_81DUF155/PF02582_14/7_4e55_NODE_203_length_4429_cov_86_930296_g157_i026113684